MRRSLLALVAALGLVVPGGAHAQVSGLFPTNVVSELNVPVRIGGQLTVEFHGDQATGCAAAGLCAYSGRQFWQPTGPGTLAIYTVRDGGKLRKEAYLQLYDPNGLAQASTTTAHVRAAGVSCSDAAPTSPAYELPIAGGRLSWTLTEPGTSLLATRCAGPLDSDVLPALPVKSLTLSAAMRGSTTLDLSGAGTFASHGFAGTVSSTLSVALLRPQRVMTAPLLPRPRFRQVVVTYRAVVSGSIATKISGDPNPGLCDPLGSCGLLGTISAAPRVDGATADVYALDPGNRPTRDLLTALGLSTGHGANGVIVGGELTWTRGGTVTENLIQGMDSCTDSAPLGAGAIILERVGSRLVAHYLAGFPLGGSVRTRCPGPVPVGGPFNASGSVPMRVLARRTIRIRLTTATAVADDGYSGRGLAALTVTLTRRRVLVRT